MVLVIVLVAVFVVVLLGVGIGVSSRSRRLRARPRVALPPVAGPGSSATQVIAPPGEAAEVEEVPAAEAVLAGRPALRDRLGKARQLLGGYLDGIRGRAVDDTTFEELEEALLLADAGIATTTRVLDELKASVRSGEVEKTPEALLAALRADLEAIFAGDEPALSYGDGEGPTVWLFVGVNGVGKTTTIGKVAARERAEGRTVVLAAGDTFRAAAGEQLETWAERADATLIRGADGADPSSVIFDAVAHAAARGADLVLADTAGRLHTKINLMEELRKVRRVAERPPGQLTEVLLVLDATTGQNGLVQAKQFTEAVAVTGVVLTKLDGTAKGGVVLAIRSELGLPIKLVGVGETAADLVHFDAAEFVAALFG
ncbi:MAG: signal recognition particle-docking protein FtsY [Acidimicrobiales bacterium]|jgi:fused signal recognition particle receptor